ncbi:MAG: hypothetical protein IJA79_06660 [Desulfovibrio sp.]|nr:hypothetical protein [Desulfovibrio sp.]
MARSIQSCSFRIFPSQNTAIRKKKIIFKWLHTALWEIRDRVKKKENQFQKL